MPVKPTPAATPTHSAAQQAATENSAAQQAATENSAAQQAATENSATRQVTANDDATGDSGPGITLTGVTRRFRGADRAAVDDISLHVSAGKTLCVVGPSGCGKSTSLRLIAGLEVPDAGSIALGDRDITSFPPDQRDVAMVFQGFALYPHMRVRDILAFPLKMRKVPKPERTREVAQVAEFLNITALLERFPHQLSGGERQRVAMGRAIVRRPQIFLFDEPLSNLDAALRTSLRGELKRLLATLGKTSVYVTHDQAEAMTLADEIAVMRQGKIEQIASPRQIYTQPASAFVAKFFGSPGMNLLRLTTEEARSFSQLAGNELPKHLGRDHLLGVRPEHLKLGTDHDSAPKTGHQPRVTAKVLNVEPMGSETVAYLQAFGHQLVARVHGWQQLQIESEVALSLEANSLHWFDPETEERLT